MPRSDRSLVVAAIFGLTATSFGIGSWVTSEWAYRPHLYPHYQEGPKEPDSGTPATTSSGVQTFEEKAPCHQPRNRDQADLCAQWRAADAAEQAAEYAWWQLVLSALGVLGLGITLWFNYHALEMARESGADTDEALRYARQSAEAAREANSIAKHGTLQEKIERRKDEARLQKQIESSSRQADAAQEAVAVAQNTAKAQLRAYLDFDGIRVSNITTEREGTQFLLMATIKNFGQTPAKSAVVISKTMVVNAMGTAIQHTPREELSFAGIAPTDHATHRMFMLMETAVFDRVLIKTSKLIVEITVSYTDVFGEQQLLRSAFESHGLDHDFGFVAGTRSMT